MTTSTTTTSTENYKDYNDNSVVVLLRARARAREAQKPTEKYMREMEAFAGYWRLAVGVQLPPIGRQRIAERLAEGVEAELIAEVIDQTSAAPRPSWAYCSAILDRLKREGISTLSDYQQRQAARRAGSAFRAWERADGSSERAAEAILRASWDEKPEI